MTALRLLSLLLCTLVVAGASSARRSACAAVPAAWHPYRSVLPSEAEAIVPQQYQEYVVAQPTIETPIDALTDADLNRMSNACCSDLYSDVVFQNDPVIGFSAAEQSSNWEILPGNLIWHSYWAGAKEPRTSGLFLRETNSNLSLLDVSLGGRTSILRNGYYQNGRPLGWELQIEGAAQLRLNLDQDFDFDSSDFRFGVPLIYAPDEQLHWKFAYYHLSSHVGDEFLVRNPGYTRINFSRDVLVVGVSYFPLPAWRWYSEAGWAFYEDEGSEQWEVQFGLDYANPGPTGQSGTPFVAFNGHLREELDFGGNLVLQAGWLWRGRTGRVVRTGLHYYNGKSPQYEFFNAFEHQLGLGIWQEY